MAKEAAARTAGNASSNANALKELHAELSRAKVAVLKTVCKRANLTRAPPRRRSLSLPGDALSLSRARASGA
eukprot:5774669-Prymnesium_polylepis.1